MHEDFTDEGSSGATSQRPALLRCLKALDRGDSLTVWKLDRLGRGYEACNMPARLQTASVVI